MIGAALPEGPDRVFRLAEPILTRFFGEGRYRLGGGTALAAVWNHRHSTDLDLFMDAQDFRRVVLDDRLRQSLAEELERVLAPELLELRRGGLLKVFSEAGELGLYTPPPPIEAEAPTHCVRGTGVALERTEVILARKLHGRMLEQGDFVARDLYDLAAAASFSPDALDAALDSLSEDEVESIREGLGDLPSDFMTSRHLAGAPLLDLRTPRCLASQPDKCLAVVRAALESRVNPRPSP